MNNKPIALFFTIFIVIIVGLVVIQQSATNVESIDIYSTNSSSSFIYTSAQSLSPVEEGITSSSATTYNNTYLSFDGVDDYVDLDNNIIYDENSFSIWAYRNGEQGTSRLLQKSTGARPVISFLSNKIYFPIYNGTDFFNVTTTSTTNNKEWFHIVATSSKNGELQIFFNGVKEANVSIFGNIEQVSNNFVLGRQGQSDGSYFNGFMDEVRFYNKTLTTDEITEIYNSGLNANSSLPDTGLVSWYSFNEGTGTTLYDKIGNNDGTLTNFQ